MIKKPKVQQKNKKIFQKYNKYYPIKDNIKINNYVYGKHPVLMALLYKKRELKKLFVTEKTINIVEEFIKQNSVVLPKSLEIKKVDIKYLNSLVPENTTHQGFLLECGPIPKLSLHTFLNSIEDKKAKLPNILILDEITDPHNFGAIVRSASAFNFKNIIITEKNSATDSSIISKTSAGMIETVNLIQVTNLNSAINELREIGYWVIGLEGSAKQNIDEIEFKSIALIIGSEGRGIRELVKKGCDMLVKIPISENVESLNASVATGIALYELSKK